MFDDDFDDDNVWLSFDDCCTTTRKLKYLGTVSFPIASNTLTIWLPSSPSTLSLSRSMSLSVDLFLFSSCDSEFNRVPFDCTSRSSDLLFLPISLYLSRTSSAIISFFSLPSSSLLHGSLLQMATIYRSWFVRSAFGGFVDNDEFRNVYGVECDFRSNETYHFGEFRWRECRSIYRQ